VKTAAEVLFTVAHIVTAIVGFLAVGMTGGQALVARRNPSSVSARRYFKQGPNWIAMSFLLTPVFGGLLEVVDNYPDVHLLWPWLALGIWIVAVAAAVAVHWPAERRIQRHLAAVYAPGGTPSDAGDLDGRALGRDCILAAASSALIVACFVAALIVMVTQPA
jgi:hypothetical protein